MVIQEKKEFRSDINSVVCAGVFPWENQGTWTHVEVNDAIFPHHHAEYRKTCAQGLRFNKGNNCLASSKSQWNEIALFSCWKNTGTTSILWYTALIHAMAVTFPTTFFLHHSVQMSIHWERKITILVLLWTLFWPCRSPIGETQPRFDT